MTTTAQPAGTIGGERLCLGGELTVYTVETIRAQLLDALHCDPQVDLDLTEVAEIDGAGVQLLLAAHREAESRAGRLRLLGASAAVTDMLALAGLPALGLMHEAAEP